jgi:hypothetical protein
VRKACLTILVLTNPFDHWAKAQSELASVFDKNGKKVRRPPLRWPEVANEPLAIEGVASEPPLHFVSKCMNEGEVVFSLKTEARFVFNLELKNEEQWFFSL